MIEGIVQHIISTLTGELVIFADQNAPRPASEFWSVKINSIVSVGMAHYSNGVDGDGVQEVVFQKEATVYLQRFGKDSLTKCRDLQNRIQLATVGDFIASNNLAFYDTSPVMNLNELQDGSSFETRAGLDIFIRYGEKLRDNVGIIEIVRVTNNL